MDCTKVTWREEKTHVAGEMDVPRKTCYVCYIFIEKAVLHKMLLCCIVCCQTSLVLKLALDEVNIKKNWMKTMKTKQKEVFELSCSLLLLTNIYSLLG